MKAVFLSLMRPLLEPHLPAGVDTVWCGSADEVRDALADADIAWVDQNNPASMRELLKGAPRLKWVSTIYAGLDSFPVETLQQRGTILTNGVGINTVAVAEYAVMGVLSLAKNYPEVVRSADRREWLFASPGVIELADSRALIIGYGAIGKAIGQRLRGFDVDVTGVARTARPDENVLGADEWRARLGEYDWIILAAPSTDETQALIGAAELAAMKPSAHIVNIARGACIDQDALVAALQAKSIAGAFLDVTTPEPLPADHILWTLPNVQHSMHLSGRSQSRMYQRAATLFLENLSRFLAGQPMKNVVDLALGY